jgi:hypothetical protein
MTPVREVESLKTPVRQYAPRHAREGHFSGETCLRGRRRSAHVSKIERAATYVGLEIIGKFADVLDVDPMGFFRAPARRAQKR